MDNARVLIQSHAQLHHALPSGSLDDILSTQVAFIIIHKRSPSYRERYYHT